MNELVVQKQSTMLAVVDKYTEAEKLGRAIARAGWFGDITESSGVLAAVTMMSENLTPAQFKARWHLANSGMMTRVTNSVLGDFKMAGGKYSFVRADREVCEMTFEKDGVSFRSKVTMEEMLQTKHPYAKKQTDYKAPDGKRFLKDNWAEHPDDMLFARCCGKALRRVWPEGMGGIYLKDEVEADEFVAPKEAVPLSPSELKEKIAKMKETPSATVQADVVVPDDVTVCPIPGKECFGKAWEDFDSDRLAKVLKLDRAKFSMLTDGHVAEIERILAQREADLQAEAAQHESEVAE